MRVRERPRRTWRRVSGKTFLLDRPCAPSWLEMRVWRRRGRILKRRGRLFLVDRWWSQTIPSIGDNP